MFFIVLKYLITSAVVVIISEVAKRSDKIGALIAALPMVTLLVLIWLYYENQPKEKIVNHAYYTFFYVIPTLPMFLLFPYLFKKIGFWGAIGGGVVVTVISFIIFALLVEKIGVKLY